MCRFKYTWSDNTYIIYYIRWCDPFSSPRYFFYVLSPLASSTITDGHCAESDALILAAGKWTSQLHDEIFVYDDGEWIKSKELWNSVHGASWADVILDPATKELLIQDVAGFFESRDLYKEYAIPWKRGIILHGPPGNGKTVSIRALMATLAESTSMPIPSLYVKSLTTQCSTEQWAIRQIFQKARDQAPCLLVFEDLDSLVGDKVRSYFLNEVDGLESNDGILMIGSTNYLERLDPAIAKRPSRFDRKYLYSLPGREERRLYGEYWKVKLEKNGKVLADKEVLDIVAGWTEGFSFAYLKELWVMALLSLVREFDGENADKDHEVGGSWDELDSNGTGDQIEAVVMKEPDICTCATKCATCKKPLPASGSASPDDSSDAGSTSTAPAQILSLPLPSMTIPSHLADNLLLKVIKHHIAILHKEMDNTKPGNKSKTEKASSVPQTCCT